MYMLTFRRNLLHLCSDLMYRWLFVNAATHLILIYNVLRKGKKKVRMSLCKPRKRDVEEWLHQFLSTALCGGEWSGVRQGRYTFRGVGDPSINQEPHTHLHTHTHTHTHIHGGSKVTWRSLSKMLSLISRDFCAPHNYMQYVHQMKVVGLRPLACWGLRVRILSGGEWMDVCCKFFVFCQVEVSATG